MFCARVQAQKKTAEWWVKRIVYLSVDERCELWPGAQTSYPGKTHFTDCWQKQTTQIKLPDLTSFHLLLTALEKI